ncbi:MAG: RNA methyltransferase [Rikenellaceae bacterium]|nr:RNA methyltransferase [Rikenellaceae bacterium]MCL2693172.1 RNA methyltransferase [Rikenellaceae bacterium]
MPTKADILLVRSLGDKKGRAEHGLFMVEGPKLVSEALISTLRVRRVFVAREYAEEFAMACRAGSHSTDSVQGIVEEVSRKDLERMSGLRTPQGVLALVEIPRHAMPAPENLRMRLSLALDDIQDPGNLGTILRTADWFGIGDVFCSPATADCFNSKAVQASMGAVLRVRVHYTALPDLLVRYAGLPVYGALLDGENIYDTDLTPHGIIVVGNEGSGISPAVAAAVTRKLFIPPYANAGCTSESLNVAAATSIICYEFRRP